MEGPWLDPEVAIDESQRLFLKTVANSTNDGKGN